MNTPPLHPEWLITFWLTTPIIKNLKPHVTMFILLILGVGFIIYFIRKNKTPEPDKQEVYFQHLLQQKQVIEGKIEQLEKAMTCGQITSEDYEKKLVDYNKYLNKVKQDLLQFT